MSRRVNLPAADDLFRPTVVPDPAPALEAASVEALAVGKESPKRAAKPEKGTASGRVKHDEKVTVYVTADELLDLEHARLALRRDHGVAVDRGRLVRTAVALALADLEDHGADSAIVRRLMQA